MSRSRNREIAAENTLLRCSPYTVELISNKKPALVEVLAMSTIEAALKNVAIGKVGILNFANGTKPGGGYLSGATAQEESLCRHCPALYSSLTTMPEYYQDNEAIGPQSGDSCIISYGVEIVRDLDYSLLDEYPKVTVITAAAPWQKKCQEAGINVTAAMIDRRVEHIILSAIRANVEILILGAWGCGVFGNDPEVIAGSFALALASKYHFFKKVIFAILPDETSENKNLEVFRKYFTC